MKQMTSKARVLAALAHQDTDRVPLSWGFGINPPALRDLSAHLSMTPGHVRDLLRQTDDIGQISPLFAGLADRCAYHGDVRTDERGIPWRFHSFSDGGYEEQFHNPLSDARSVSDIERYPFARADWWDYSTLPAQIEQINRDDPRAIRLGNANPFEQVNWLRGFENILMDTLAEPDMVHALMRRCTDYFLEFLRRALNEAA